MKTTNCRILRIASLLLLALLTACDGGNGGDSKLSLNPPLLGHDPTAGGFPDLSQIPSNNLQLQSCASTVLSAATNLEGSVSYERRPMAAWSGLTENIEIRPARGVVVEAVAVKDGLCSQQVLATTLSDGNGDYGFQIADNIEVCVQVRAQLYRSGANGRAGWNVQVTDNTNGNAPYYLLDNFPATASAAPIRNLLADSGWDGSDYSADRAAAPFAILDSVCEVIDVMVDPLNGLEQNQSLPLLNIRWSVDNVSVDGDLSLGEIGTAFYRNSFGINELFLRGDKDVNTDEYDPHVIVHELTHYIARSFLRSDSLGGSHSLASLLDISMAFEEGWANAFAGIVLDGTMTNGNEVLFRDSRGTGGFSAGGFLLNSREAFEVPRGWFSEGSVHRLFYDLYDSENSLSDRLTLSLPEIYAALKTQANSSALISVFNFFEALRNQNPLAIADFSLLLAAENINGIGDYAEGETNDAGLPDLLPVYTPFDEGQPASLCSSNVSGEINRAGNYRYLQFTASMKRDYFFNVETSGVAGEDDGVAVIDILKNGSFVTDSSIAARPGDSLEVRYPLSPGDYVLAISHYDNIIPDGDAPGRKCFNISVN